MAEERKLVSVLFADVVGSTAMGAQHDPEVIRLTLARAFARLAEVIAGHGGVVEKFIGDEVMAVFGIPAAHDDDADRAVRAAFGLQNAVRELNGSGGLQLALRIGVNTGEVVTGGGGGGQSLVTGSAVNEAARLRAAAAPGEIVVGSLTRRLTSRTVRYAEPRQVDAKGLGAIEATTALALETELPEQRRGIEGMRAPLIGRDEELRLLVETYRRAADGGKAYLATVFGAPGAGKSRLSEELTAQVGHERVRYGRCLPYGQGITFYAVQGMLRGDAGIATTDARPAALAKLRAAVDSAIGAGSEDAELVHRRVSVVAGLAPAEEALADVAEEELAEELRWGVRRFFEGRASTGPLLLLFEDIHWAEPGLLDLIEHLADWGRGPLFVLCLARPDLLDLRPNWGGGKTNATAINVEPLSSDETRELIGALLAIDGLPDALRDEVVTRADGNPLYVEEFLRMLMESDQIEHRDGRWVATKELGSLALPPSLQGLIAARLDRVPPETKRALQHAAVIGRFFSTTALAALLGSSPADALRDAARRDLVLASDDRGTGGGRLHRFKHVLIRDVAYQAVPKSERAALHDRYGRWYEEALGERRDEFLEILGYHAEQAHLLARELGLTEARALGERALGLLLPAATRARKRADLAAAVSLYERAAAVADAVGAPEAQRVEARGYAALARRSMRTTTQTKSGVAAQLDVARAAGPSEVLADLLRQHAWDLADPEASAPLFEEALATARALDRPDLIAIALLSRRAPAHWRGDLVEAARIAEEAIAYMRRSGATERLSVALNALAITYVQSGRFANARALREEGLRLADASGARGARYNARFGLMNLERNRGDRTRALELGAECLALAAETGSPDVIDFTRGWVAAIESVAGRAAEARATLEELRARADRAADPIRWALMTGDLSYACLVLKDLDAAGRYAEEAYALRGQLTEAIVMGVVAYALAVVRAAQGRPVEAERLFLESLAAVPPQWGIPRARTQQDYGELLLAQGRVAEAREQLGQALAFFSDPEAEPRRREIDAILRRCDEAVAR